ncbi:MAG: DNA polymerase III subunit alpha [Chloroflexi bacterium]|nr:DNA polymerase III subunit alpha [Chloroflexota bacterium]
MIHLHVHSRYSLLRATASVTDLARRAAAEDMRHLALTDDNALYAAVAFDKACRSEGVQPIIGMALTVRAPRPLADREGERPETLILLADGPAGYRSLCHLSSLIQARPDRAEVARRGVGWAALVENQKGLIALAGGRESRLERLLRAGDEAAAARYVAHLAGAFDDRAYLALEIHQPSDNAIAAQVMALGERFGVPVAAVQPIYCLDAEERSRLRLLAAIDHNLPLSDVPAHLIPGRDDPARTLHWLSAQEMAERFADFPAALTETEHIAARCRPALPDGRPIWPALDLPNNQAPDQALAQRARVGLNQRYNLPDTLEPGHPILARLQRELEAIVKHGYSPLFLLVADIVHYARSRDIPVSTRGSVANSLVAYCLGVTTVDPIEHDLLFERFLSPARLDAPDIDLDFCSRRRDEVLAYVRQTYGEDRMALVGTVSTMGPKSALRETAKAYGLDDAAIAALSRRLPRGRHPNPRPRRRSSLQDLAEELSDARLQRVALEAAALVGQPHHLSVHPGGIVVTPGPLADYVPVQWAPKGFLITQFDHIDVEAIGLPKIDLLGIRALTVLADAADLVRKHHDPSFRLAAIPLDDPITGDLIQRGETVGVFQCESTGAQRTLRQLKARRIKDMAIANAFFKPGPATGGMARAFVRRYRGEEPVRYLHPALEPILAHTRGVLIFQEQILRVATEIAGLDWKQADHLRRGMSKFRPEEMAAMQEAFVAGCMRPRPDGPGFSLAQAQALWEQVAAFAGYGFNQGHATAYADVSYRSAYLKAHYPAEFLCARLADRGGFHHPAIYMAEAVRLGVEVRPPHINRSGPRFTLTREPPVLWMGLDQVRDLRRATIRSLMAGRPFEGVRDVLTRVTMQRKEIEHLIQCGALDGLSASRSAMLAELDAILAAGDARQLAFDFFRPEVEPETLAQRLVWETHILGQPVSVHPLDAHPDLRAGGVSLAEARRIRGRRVRVAAARLPGWTGGKGFFLGDGRDYVVAIPRREDIIAPEPWLPLWVEGRWVVDEWGGHMLEVESVVVNEPSWDHSPT